MDKQQDNKIEKLRFLMWDYPISAQECYDVLLGTQQTIGHYDSEKLFRKLLESFSWFAILDILPIDRIRELLSDEMIKSLRNERLRERYGFIKDKLSKLV